MALVQSLVKSFSLWLVLLRLDRWLTFIAGVSMAWPTPILSDLLWARQMELGFCQRCPVLREFILKSRTHFMSLTQPMNLTSVMLSVPGVICQGRVKRNRLAGFRVDKGPFILTLC